MYKLQIYYQPVQKNHAHLESLTISFSEFNEAQNTFKKKIVLERDGVKYKIKEYPKTLNEIIPFLSTLDITKYNSSDVNKEESYFFIKYDDKTISTSNAEDIKELLEWADFYSILAYDIDKYKKCN